MNPTSIVDVTSDTPAPATAAVTDAHSAAPTDAQADVPADALSDSAVDTTTAAATDTTPASDAALPADSASAGAAPAAPAAAAPVQSARALLKQLQHDFTAFRNCLPLAIGIDKQLLARLPNLDRKTMRAALGIHTGSLRYLKAMEKATVRFDLDGSAGAEVTEVHRTHAKEVLQQRFKKEAERKKAERDAAQAEEADRLRQEKLQLLASKFSRH